MNLKALIRENPPESAKSAFYSFFHILIRFGIRFEKCPLHDYKNMKKLHRRYSFLEKNEKRMCRHQPSGRSRSIPVGQARLGSPSVTKRWDATSAIAQHREAHVPCFLRDPDVHSSGIAKHRGASRVFCGIPCSLWNPRGIARQPCGP